MILDSRLLYDCQSSVLTDISRNTYRLTEMWPSVDDRVLQDPRRSAEHTVLPPEVGRHQISW